MMQSISTHYRLSDNHTDKFVFWKKSENAQISDVSDVLKRPKFYWNF